MNMHALLPALSGSHSFPEILDIDHQESKTLKLMDTVHHKALEKTAPSTRISHYINTASLISVATHIL